MAEAAGRPPETTGRQDPLADQIAAALPHLSKKHREIARYILDHQDTVAFASAADVGIRTNTSAATVVRFSQALGYEGYTQLQAAVRRRLFSQQSAMQRFKERLAEPVPPVEPSTHVFATDIENIERTMVAVANDLLQSAVSEIRRARQVLIVGSGLAAGLVEFLAYSLQVIDLPVRSVTNGEEPLALALAFLQAEDVLVGISFRHNPGYVIRAFEVARAIGAKSIGITNSQVSPVVRWADFPFVVVTSRVAPVSAPVAAVSLCNAIVASLTSGDAEPMT